MRIAILSDVHANLEALEVCLQSIRVSSVDAVVCLGDVVGYGADHNACCDLIRESTLFCLLGNHDAAVIGVMDTDFYYPAARQALFRTRESLSEDNFRWLYSLPYSHQAPGVGFFHGAPVLPSGFYYVVRPKDAEAHLQLLARLEPYTFIGHSHLTKQFLLSPNGVQSLNSRKISAHPGKDERYIINVGSVGQPRDKDPRACYGLFDSHTGAFRHVRLEYDHHRAAEKIRAAGLDQKFATRLAAGT